MKKSVHLAVFRDRNRADRDREVVRDRYIYIYI